VQLLVYMHDQFMRVTEPRVGWRKAASLLRPLR
jgi:hypothetical protein